MLLWSRLAQTGAFYCMLYSLVSLLNGVQAYDGAPTSNLYGSDLKPEFMELGYDLFLDRASMQAHFIAADIFAATSPLDQLDGTVDIIQASSFFHLFGRDEQLQAGAKVMKLLKHVSGSMIFGRQMGRPGGAGTGGSKSGGKAYWHDEESFHKLWNEIANEAGVKVDIEIGFEEGAIRNSNKKEQDDQNRRLRYCVRLK